MSELPGVPVNQEAKKGQASRFYRAADVQAYTKQTLKVRPKFLEPVSVSDQEDGVVVTHPKIQSVHCTNKRQVQEALRSIRIAEYKAVMDAVAIAIAEAKLQGPPVLAE